MHVSLFVINCNLTCLWQKRRDGVNQAEYIFINCENSYSFDEISKLSMLCFYAVKTSMLKLVGNNRCLILLLL